MRPFRSARPENTVIAMKNLLFLALLLPLGACSVEVEATSNSTTEDPVVEVTPVSIETSVHNVKCGCAIDSIGSCGNYVEIDGEYAEFANGKEFDLTEMAWCGAEGDVQAEVAGTLEGGIFTATAFAVKE